VLLAGFGGGGVRNMSAPEEDSSGAVRGATCFDAEAYAIGEADDDAGSVYEAEKELNRLQGNWPPREGESGEVTDEHDETKQKLERHVKHEGLEYLGAQSTRRDDPCEYIDNERCGSQNCRTHE
jgi:hypothetical protein